PSIPAEMWPEGAQIVRAPYLGTFYRAPKPGSAPYVEVGSRVTSESELCLVEVMKLFTTVRAADDGIVHAVLADDGALVEADQALFVIVKG
ncbi:MAG: acetyl-CoA carboxylase, biotin carboxyl carrier protein, partial [Alphaproteobacteria bacterium HGW-Alphaproteobacteria-13]